MPTLRFVRTGAVCAVFAILTTAAALAQSDTLTADQIVQKHLDALGGVEKMKAMKTARMTGKAVLGGGQIEAPMVMQVKDPRSMRIEMTLQGKSLVQAFDGTTAWMINPFQGSGEAVKMPEDETKELAESAELNGPFLDYKAKGVTVELLGKEDVEGTPAYKLKVTRKSGKTETMFLDASSFLTLKSMSKRKQMGQEFEIEVCLGNYKPVAGVLMAHTIEQKMGGRTMMQMELEKVEVNVPIEDAVFKMPEPKKEEPEKKKEPEKKP
jgi:outer membrane lipoprotein-sorting protein